MKRVSQIWFPVLILLCSFAATWVIYWENRNYTPPLILLIAGSVISLLLALCTFLILASKDVLLEKESKSHWELALDSGGFGVWDLHPETGKSYYSKAWKDMLGYSSVEISNLHEEWIKLIHPNDKSKALQALKDYISGRNDTYLIEHRLRCKDGSYKWILSQGKALERDDNRQATRIIGTHIDVTARRNAQSRARELATLAHLTRNVVILTDPEGKITWVNLAFRETTGYSIEEAIGHQPGELLQGPDTDSHTIKYISESLHQEKEVRCEVLNYRKDGSPIWVALEICPVFDDQGELISWVSLQEDITAIKQVQAMKDEFVAMVSHELRTPLTSIQGSLGLLARFDRDKLSEKSRILVDIAVANCKRLVRLISDILDIDRMEAGLLEFEMQEIDMAEVITRGVEENEGFASKFKISLETVGTHRACPIEGDFDRLLQVLDNLISNACKYSPEGSTVTVRLLPHDKDVRVEIEDQGSGIPEEMHDKVFAKFMQVDSSDRREKGGSGLGLHFTSLLIKAHKGRIGFDSKEGEGTCFFFELPRKQ